MLVLEDEFDENISPKSKLFDLVTFVLFESLAFLINENPGLAVLPEFPC